MPLEKVIFPCTQLKALRLQLIGTWCPRSWTTWKKPRFLSMPSIYKVSVYISHWSSPHQTSKSYPCMYQFTPTPRVHINIPRLGEQPQKNTLTKEGTEPCAHLVLWTMLLTPPLLHQVAQRGLGSTSGLSWLLQGKKLGCRVNHPAVLGISSGYYIKHFQSPGPLQLVGPSRRSVSYALLDANQLEQG